jgi:hypothetical protein
MPAVVSTSFASPEMRTPNVGSICCRLHVSEAHPTLERRLQLAINSRNAPSQGRHPATAPRLTGWRACLVRDAAKLARIAEPARLPFESAGHRDLELVEGAAADGVTTDPDLRPGESRAPTAAEQYPVANPLGGGGLWRNLPWIFSASSALTMTPSRSRCSRAV